MGSISFAHKAQASSAGECFDMLYENAIEEKGRNMYNGTISTCSMGRCIKRFDKYSDKNLKEAQKIVSDMDYGSDTRVANYIDLGVSHYEVRTVKKIPRTYNAKYEMRYCIRDYNGKLIFSDKSKTTCNKKAESIVLEKGDDITISKEYVKISGNANVSDIRCEVKTVKSKPKSNANKKVVEIHQYYFFGWAAE